VSDTVHAIPQGRDYHVERAAAAHEVVRELSHQVKDPILVSKNEHGLDERWEGTSSHRGRQDGQTALERLDEALRRIMAAGRIRAHERPDQRLRMIAPSATAVFLFDAGRPSVERPTIVRTPVSDSA
jgi:hypothetical protein